jgi:hypothetical protein
LLRPLGIHRHPVLAHQAGQAGAELLETVQVVTRRQGRRRQGRRRPIQLRQREPLHGRRRDASATLLSHPIGQVTGLVTKQSVSGEGGGVHRFALEQVHPMAGGAPARQEGGHQQGAVEGAQLLCQQLHLQGEMAPQGGVAPAHQQPLVQRAGGLGLGQGWSQLPADRAQPLGRRLRIQGAGVGQHKQERGRVRKPPPQRGPIPAQQQRTAVQGLGSGGVVVQHDDFAPLCHGTIVP